MPNYTSNAFTLGQLDNLVNVFCGDRVRSAGFSQHDRVSPSSATGAGTPPNALKVPTRQYGCSKSKRVVVGVTQVGPGKVVQRYRKFAKLHIVLGKNVTHPFGLY